MPEIFHVLSRNRSAGLLARLVGNGRHRAVPEAGAPIVRFMLLVRGNKSWMLPMHRSAGLRLALDVRSRAKWPFCESEYCETLVWCKPAASRRSVRVHTPLPMSHVPQASRLRVRAPSRCSFPKLAARRRQNPQPRTAALQLWLWLLSALLATASPAAASMPLNPQPSTLNPRPLPAWPPPPAEPCIVYVRELAGPKDIGAKAPFFTRLANALTGAGSSARNLNRPFGLSLDDAGNLVVTDTGADAVCYLDLARKKWLRWTAVGGRRFVSPVAAVHQGKTFYARTPPGERWWPLMKKAGCNLQ